jgi:hypothetical protein
LHIYGAQVTESSEPLPYVKTDGTLLEGHGYVTTWYDQSGNSNNATQTTAASQPKIVDAGVLVTENGKAALDFDGVDDSFNLSHTIGGSNFSAFHVVNILFGAVFGGKEFGPLSFFKSTNRYFCTYNGGFYKDSVLTGGDFEYLLATTISSIETETLSAFVNSSDIHLTQQSGSFDEDFSLIGRRRAGDNFQGQAKELILYPSDQSANREAIESNIANYYGITLS